MTCFELRKRDLGRLIEHLSRSCEVLAPVKRDGVVNFEAVSADSQISLNEHSYLPLKRLFFRPSETLMEFKKDKLTVPKKKRAQRIIIGAKRCDLNSIKRQDIMFTFDSKDPYYMAERERTLLIGYQCKRAYDEYCFCGSMDLEDCQDIMIYDRGPVMLLETTSKKGDAFIRKHGKFFKSTDQAPKESERVIKGSDRLKNTDISSLYDNPKWKRGVDLCLSCAACVLLCPSCYCFTIDDENEMDLVSGKRTRTHASCQLKSFTRVAGDHVFRDTREARFKHRIYHQLQWFKERHGTNLCTGCGRCIRYCPTRIDFVEMINGMK